MTDKTDNVRKWKEAVKQRTVEDARYWIARKLRNYEGPTRAGTPRGDPIGFSVNKYRACLYMILYPYCLDLKLIARIVGTSEGTIRVWRTQQPFQKKAEEACQDFARLLLEVIDRLALRRNVDMFKKGDEDDLAESKMRAKLARDLGIGVDDIEPPKPSVTILGNEAVVLKSDFEGDEKGLESLTDKKVIIIDDDPNKLRGTERIRDPASALIEVAERLPFYNPIVTEVVIHDLAKKLKAGVPSYGYMLYAIDRAFKVWDQERLKKWRRHPVNMELTKAIIGTMIDDLSDPNAWARLGEKGIKEIAENLKETIYKELDWLS